MAVERDHAGLARRVYALALKALPRRFREARGEELLWTFERRLEQSTKRGLGRLPFVVGELAGVVRAGFSVRRQGWMDGVRQDARTTVRTLRRAPGFGLTAVAVLALGIGASVAIFSAVDAVLLAPLPLKDPERLVSLYENNIERGWVRGQVAPANYLDWQERLDGFTGMAGYDDNMRSFELGGSGEPRRVLGNDVTGNFFDVIGVAPILGRVFEDRATWSDSPAEVVLSETLWREAFNGDPDLVGRTIQLDRADVTVIGVMPSSLRFPREGTELWVSMRWDREWRTLPFFRRAHGMRVVGRLARGEPVERAKQRVEELGRTLQREYPELNAGMDHTLSPLHEYVSARSRSPLLILFAAVGVLLLTACANVGNLVLVRGLARERELAVRGALGASRRRVIAQLITENGMIAVLGGGVGLLLGTWGTRLIALHRPAGLETWQPLGVDARVVGFAIGVTFLSALLFGILPAIRSARPGVAALRDAARTTAGQRPTRISHALVTLEIALAMLLVFGAGLLTRSMRLLEDVEPGVDTSNVLLMSVSLPTSAYESSDRVIAFWDELVQRVREVPGVVSAGAVSYVPLRGGGWGSDFTVDGWAPDRFGTEVRHREMVPGYIETMRVPLIRGRLLDSRDVAGVTDPGVLINETLARRYFPGEDPIGQRVAFDRVAEPRSFWHTIVGIVGDEHQSGLDAEPMPEFYEHVSTEMRRTMTIVVRTPSDPASFAPRVTAVIRSMDAALPVYAVRTMEEVRAASLAQSRFVIAMFGIFAAFALLLAVVGVFGVTSQAAKARMHEIGIRIALGARSGDVERMMLRRGLVMIAAGIATGAAIAIATGRYMTSLLFGVEPTDPVTFAFVIVVLAGTAALAIWMPARVASRSDPLQVLRES